ncbi:MAG: SusD/RagB family nutrient-binding outer membrane lipoprotein, partial [Chitinophagaceae bacterium]
TIDDTPSHYDAAYYGDRQTAAALNNGNGTAGIGQAILNSYAQPVYLISAAESYFLQAEASQRGWITGNSETLFNDGITASFEQLGVFANGIGADSAAEAYYTQGKPLADWSATPANQKIEAIIVQKWASAAITDQYEQWVEYRRTGFPATDILPLSKYPGNSMHIPNRYMFPKSESQSNQGAYNKAVATGNDPQNSKVFWMK